MKQRLYMLIVAGALSTLACGGAKKQEPATTDPGIEDCKRGVALNPDGTCPPGMVQNTCKKCVPG